MRLLMITVRGKQKHWEFDFYGDPKYIPEWRADGLEIDEIINVIPDWVPAPLIKPYVFLQDVFNLRNPFRT